jgi:hypothetical protein
MRTHGLYLEWHPYWISLCLTIELFLNGLLDSLSPSTKFTGLAEVLFTGQVFLLSTMGCRVGPTDLSLSLTTLSNKLSTLLLVYTQIA